MNSRSTQSTPLDKVAEKIVALHQAQDKPGAQEHLETTRQSLLHRDAADLRIFDL